MLENLGRPIAGFVRGLLVLLAGGTVADADRSPQTAAVGSVIEIDPGDGPEWGTLSSLTAHASNPRLLYAVTDQDSPPLRIVEIEVSGSSAKVVRQIKVDATGFEGADVEGLVMKPDGGFWLASEGAEGNTPPNVLLDIDANGHVLRSVKLPDDVAAKIQRQGFEGVALVAPAGGGDRLYASFQSGLAGDAENITRIAVVDPATEKWSFFSYPLEEADDGFSGLSDILHLGAERFAVLERDGKGGKHSLKWIVTFDLASLTGTPIGQTPPLIEKQKIVDLVPMFLDDDRKVEKEIEGLTIAADGQVYAVTDNDNKRATLLLSLGSATELFGPSAGGLAGPKTP